MTQDDVDRVLNDPSFNAQLDQALQQLRAQMVRDVIAEARGGALGGGIRRNWRDRVTYLARLFNAIKVQRA